MNRASRYWHRLKQADQAIQRVRDLHQPVVETECRTHRSERRWCNHELKTMPCDQVSMLYCNGCGYDDRSDCWNEEYPCPTLRALDGEDSEYPKPVPHPDDMDGGQG